MKDTYFLEEIKSLIKESGDFGPYLYQLMKKCPSIRMTIDPRCIYSRTSIVQLFVLFKLLAIPSIHDALMNEFSGLLSLGKDVLYRVRNSSWMPWRQLLYKQAQLCERGLDIARNVYEPWTLSCFILDDSDLPKSGIRMEFIGRIFSHLTRKHELGFKSLNLAFWSGKHLLHLDFSLHGELGKKRNQGLSKKQLEQRFSKDRTNKQPGFKRAQEVYQKKSDQALRMLRRAIRKGFEASYILADAWFFSANMVRLAVDTGVHLVSRPKFNHWKYHVDGKPYTLGSIIKKYRYSKAKKWSRLLKIHHVTIIAEFQGYPIRIFLYKEKKRGSKWQSIVTTDKQIGAIQAFKIYQNRWAIEVSYKELKQHLQLGKCQSLDFDAQIADVTQTLMAYNYLSHLKAARDYQSIGQLFSAISRNWLKPSIMERFWKHILAIVKQVADLFNQDWSRVMEQLIQSNNFLQDLTVTLKLLKTDLTSET